MSSDKGWWARHLGGQEQQQQPQAFVPSRTPNPVTGAPQYQPQPQYAQQAVPQQQVEPQLDIHNFTQMMEYWQGGEATRSETQRCPKCGGNHYFSRQQGARRGPPPAPMCADCGYNGLFEQGDRASWEN